MIRQHGISPARLATWAVALVLAANLGVGSARAQLGGLGKSISDGFKKAGGDISNAGKKAGGDISNAGKKAGGDISNAGKKAGGDISDAGEQLGREARKGTGILLSEAQAAGREFARARDQALGNLRKFDPDSIFNGVQQSINQAARGELAKTGANYNELTGDLDLRGTQIGRTLARWVDNFAQGNKKESRVEQLLYNVRSRRISVKLFARHCQSWGQMFPGQPVVDLYSVTQRAAFWYDFNRGAGGFDIDCGSLAPKINSTTLRKLSEGDLVAAAESSAPSAIGRIVNYERTNQYQARVDEYARRYGAGNVYFASKAFVDWASPDTLGRYAINGIVTAGASVYPQIMSDARKRARQELPSLSQWLARRGMQNADGVAAELLTGKTPRWPHLVFDVITVRYSAREKPLNAVATPWRHIDHLAFVIVWRSNTNSNLETLARTESPPALNAATRTVEEPQPTSLTRTTTEDGELYAGNLGMHYRRSPYSDGTFGALVTRAPAAGTPAATLGLEPGDVVIELDGERFRTPQDVLNHVQESTIKIINVRDKQILDATVMLP